MNNILTTVEGLLPGDTWTDTYPDKSTCVIVDRKPSKESYRFDITYVRVREDGTYSKHTFTEFGHQRFVCNR